MTSSSGCSKLFTKPCQCQYSNQTSSQPPPHKSCMVVGFLLYFENRSNRNFSVKRNINSTSSILNFLVIVSVKTMIAYVWIRRDFAASELMFPSRNRFTFSVTNWWFGEKMMLILGDIFRSDQTRTTGKSIGQNIYGEFFKKPFGRRFEVKSKS